MGSGYPCALGDVLRALLRAPWAQRWVRAEAALAFAPVRARASALARCSPRRGACARAAVRWHQQPCGEQRGCA
eukprot:359236-Chlamydomonas_euryale.AAC.5